MTDAKPDLRKLLDDYRDAMNDYWEFAGEKEPDPLMEKIVDARDAIEDRDAQLSAEIVTLKDKLESALQLCQECGKGFVDDDWALERQQLSAERDALKANRDYWAEACKEAQMHRDANAAVVAPLDEQIIALKAENARLNEALATGLMADGLVAVQNLKAEVEEFRRIHVELGRQQQLEIECHKLKAQVQALRLALFSVARDVHEAREDHVITRFTECNHNECEAVHNLLGDMPHPTEAQLKAALEGGV